MSPIRLATITLAVLFPVVGAAQEKKAAPAKEPAPYVKLSAELRGKLEQQLIGGLDQYWRQGFTAKGGGSLRMAVRVGDEMWELQLPDDQKMPDQAAKLVGKEVLIRGQFEPAPPGWSLPIFPTVTGPHKGYIIRVTSLEAAK